MKVIEQEIFSLKNSISEMWGLVHQPGFDCHSYAIYRNPSRFCISVLVNGRRDSQKETVQGSLYQYRERFNFLLRCQSHETHEENEKVNQNLCTFAP